MSSLAPGILIAAPPLGDPNFDRSVVLLASHDEEGAFGWVINGPNLMTVSELLEQAEIDVTEAGSCAERLVHRGGPVSQEQVWLIYPSGEKLPNVPGQLELADGICASASRDFLVRLSEGFETPSLRAFAGYAGWGAGQLESEIQSGAWLPAELSLELLFETDVDDVWEKAYRLQGTTPMAFTTRTVGSA